MDMESIHAIVLEVLQRASSQNADILKPAESKLREWETHPGFYTVLYVIHLTDAVMLTPHIQKFLFLEYPIKSFYRP